MDTNVLMSAIFFGGTPGRILELWREGKLKLAVSPEVVNEYEQVARRLAMRYPGVDPTVLLGLIVLNSEVVTDVALPDQVCDDPADDKFLACAITSGADVVVTGDKQLLAVSGYQGVEVLTPREFIDKYSLEMDKA